eukprot:SAG31_NODE_47_length_30979_cov_41.708841_10_plen_70_part_00
MSADHWEKISDTPAQRDVGTTYGDRGCLSNLKDPDPETACGSWCTNLDSRFFIFGLLVFHWTQNLTHNA